jgi:hypothetical protein
MFPKEQVTQSRSTGQTDFTGVLPAVVTFGPKLGEPVNLIFYTDGEVRTRRHRRRRVTR